MSIPIHFNQAKPFLAVILLQFGYAGLSIIAKFALNQGMNQHVLAVYRHVIATIVMAPFAIAFERKVRPKMTLSVFLKITLLGLLEPTIDQNLYYTGMKYTTATFTSAMCNVLPAFVFLMAWICRLEKVSIKKRHSQAKIIGTIFTVGGAMFMTLVKGANLDLPWTKLNNDQMVTSDVAVQDPVKGALLIGTGCFCWAAFIILQAITLKSYPAELSLTALICFMGSIEGTIVAFAIEKGNLAVWSIQLDAKLLTAVYSGTICSGVAYYIQGVVMKYRGPVFVSAFNPLGMVIVAVLSSFILGEILYLGRVMGAVAIVVGLYLVLWGKSKDYEVPLSLENDDKSLPSIHQLTNVNLDYNNDNTTRKSNIQDFVALDFDVTKIRSTHETM